MKASKTFFSLFLILILSNTFAQTARIKGLILDENNTPVPNVTVTCQNFTTVSNSNGFYLLKVPSNKEVTLVLTHLSLKKVTIPLNLKPNEDFEYNVVMKSDVEQMSEVVVNTSTRKRV